MSLLKYARFIFRYLGMQRNSTQMLYGSTSKTSDGPAGGDEPKKDDEDCGSLSRDVITHALSTLYNSRKYGHELPGNNVSINFEPLPGIPTGVFRETCGETLGAGVALGGSCYQNPEYFSFHHMSYYDMHTALRAYRKTCPQTGRKK